jgi:murein DD-endopeptidase MepM/ murein hydrolase activator NlpD
MQEPGFGVHGARKLNNLSGKTSPTRKVPLIRIFLVVLLVYFIKKSIFSTKVQSPHLPLEHTVRTKISSAIQEKSQTIKRGETFFTLLSKNNIKPDVHAPIVQALKTVYPNIIYENQEYSIKRQPDSSLYYFKLRSKDRCTVYTVRQDDGAYRATSRQLPLSKITLTLSGDLETSLYEAIQNAGEGPELIITLIDIYSWDINWFLDPQRGDKFKIVYEKYYHENSFIKYGKILAACYINNGRKYMAYHFHPDSSLKDYFNEKGVSLRKTFLKAPLKYRRISSGFSYSRLHPILKYRRPHLGIDYSAPVGTPVRAAGSGVVVYATTKGGYGRCIKVHHRNSYTTHYGHLSRFARGIRKNKKVNQGQIIGYVGSSGLSTGPHLDYRVQRGKAFINPLRLKSSPIKKVPEQWMDAFNRLAVKLNEKLNLEGRPYAHSE